MAVDLGSSSFAIRVERPRQALARCALLKLDGSATLPGISASFALFWPAADVLLVNGTREVALKGGDLAIIDRLFPFTIRSDGNWTAQLLDLGDRRLATRVDDERRFLAVPLDGTSDLGQVIKRLWPLLGDVSRLELDDDLAEARIAEALGDLAARLAARRMDGRTSTHASATIARARLLIDAHVADPEFGVAGLAERMGLSPRHLSSMFAMAGTTMLQAILDARMRRARTLLADPVNARRQVASVARACGFTDQAYFTRCFRRHIGMTPRDYRQNGGKL